MSNWKDTVELFNNYISHPPLIEKHLKRPPFKYILSVFVNVQKASGFLKERFSDDELKNEYYKEGKLKVKFLQVVIEEIDKTLGITQQISIKDVLRGVECEKTNEFLQNLYKAATKPKENIKPKEKKPKENKKKSLATKIEDNVNKEEKKIKKNIEKDENNKVENVEKNQIEILINDAKNIIQKITQNSNPLGNIVEFIEDDIDSMNRENDKWIKTYKESQNKLNHLEKESEEELQNYFDKLTEIQEQINDKKIKINNKKSQIFLNDKKINNLIRKIID